MRSPARALLAAALSLAASGCATLQTGPPRGGGPGAGGATIDSILADTAFAQAHIGAVVVSMRSGDTIYSRNAGRVFLPASNQKLLTGAAALAALGPDFRYVTDIYGSGQVRDGILQGDLIVRGGGDPTFSARFGEDARATLFALADSLRARGITGVRGGIVGVDSAFPGPSLGSGWAWDDLASGYAAEYGALQFNEGAVTLQIVPGSTIGSPAVVVLDPPNQHVRIYNLTATTAAGSPVELSIRRDEAGPGVTIEGSVPADTTAVTRVVAVRDPTAYFLSVLREALREAGVTVEGPALPAEQWPVDRGGVVEALLFRHRSPPLSEILPAMMKPSQNQIAETLLLTVGRELRGEATADAGAAAADSIFRAWGLPANELRMADGSGLSRYNLVSPRLLGGVLVQMDSGPTAEVWRASLPVAGVDGTLEGRMRDAPLRGNVTAKTGTLTGVRALSGYLTAADGEPVVFSFLVDHHLSSAAAVDRMVEAALEVIVRGR